MKKFLITFLLALGLALPTFGQYQPTPVINPLNAVQGVYVDANFHSVPYALAYANSGITYVIFDPSTSVVDQTNAFRHLSKASSGEGGVKLVSLVYPNVVNTSVSIQESRVNANYAVTSSTTLGTIPFDYATNLQTGGHYRFVARLYVACGSGGTKIDVGGTCSTSNFTAQYRAYTTTSIVYGGRLSAFLSAPSGSSTASQTYIEVSGELDVTNGGTLVLQFAQNASDPTPSQVLQGSTFTVTQVP